MNQLSDVQLRVLNSLSKVHDANVKLGDILAEIIAASCESGAPVNAVNAQAIFEITGVSIDGETFTIGNDIYEFLADSAQTKTQIENIGINIVAKTVKASGELTVAVQPTNGDTFTIGSKTYIFVPAGTANADGEISIGTDLAGAQAAIVAAINGTDDHNLPNPLVSAAAFSSDVSAITAFIGGTAGNAIPTTETFTAEGNAFGAATLASGADCTAANTASAVIAAINANAKSLVTASAGTGTNVVITADLAGVNGNELDVSATMANAEFNDGTDPVTSLTGGVDGTVASGMKFMADSTYMYFCPLGNTVADKNWRRVSLGSAY